MKKKKHDKEGKRQRTADDPADVKESLQKLTSEDSR